MKGQFVILSGKQICAAREAGDIVIEPFLAEHVNPNSYNFRLGPTLREYSADVLDPKTANVYVERTIGSEGFVLQPGRLYLAHTIERLGGTVYAPTFAARSSVARLGLFINLSACLGDIGYVGQWTLQLYCSHPLRVYPGMPIGQMMWWKVKGEVELYEGKYQGAVGPRTSDIHVDFVKNEARAAMPSLSSDVDVACVGPKFAALSRLSRQFPVPAAFAVPAPFLNEALDPGVLTAVDELMLDTRATVGAFLGETVTAVEQLAAGYRLTERQRQLLRYRADELLRQAPGGALAVRSSGLEEDGATRSLAGTHRSFLGLDTADQVVEAAEAAYRAWFEAPAVLARVRAGDYGSTPRLALFVQRMVTPTLAGVAFTRPGPREQPHVRLSYVDGLADSLVSGTVAGTAADTEHGPVPAAILPVVDGVRAVRGVEGHDVDVEWALDDAGWHLLQARPVTADLDVTQREREPYLALAPLYAGTLPPAHPLGDVARVYASYESKRGEAHRLARSLGFRTGRGLVLAFNAAGLTDSERRAPLQEFVDSVPAQQFVIDFSDNIRQVICDRGELVATLATRAAASAADELGFAIVREFIHGQAGVITAADDDSVLAEVATAGLLALNRGTAGAVQVRLDQYGTDAPADLAADTVAALDKARHQVIAMSAEMTRRHGATTLEWVLDGGQLCFTDFSRPPTGMTGTASGSVLSAGVGSGPVLDLRDRDELLARLSIGPAVSIDRSLDVTGHGPIAALMDEIAALPEPPIVRARLPYAVLSVLLDRVAGFVFDDGSALCHLAILLREATTPAVVTGEALPDRVMIAEGAVVPA